MARPKSNDKHLSEREAQLMSLLWNRGPLFVREMLECFPDPRPHFNTVSTTVRNLEEKGYVGHEFAKRSLGQIVRNYFSNSYAKVVSALVEEEKISVDELQEIIDMINKQNRK